MRPGSGSRGWSARPWPGPRAGGAAVLAGRSVAGGVPTPFRPFAEALASAGRAGRLPARPGAGSRSGLRWAGWFPSGGSRRTASEDESLVVPRGGGAAAAARCCPRMPGACWCWRTCTGPTGRRWRCWNTWPTTCSAERVLCVGTLRDEDGGAAVGLARALEARGSAAVLPLGRLDPAAMARMALACVGAADLPGAVQSLVAERAEGLPFLVEEVLAGLIGEGTLTERDGRWQISGTAPALGCRAPSPMRCGGAWTGWMRIRAASSARPRCWAAGSTGRCWARSPACRRSRGRGAAAGCGPAAGRGRPGQLPVPARADA